MDLKHISDKFKQMLMENGDWDYDDSVIDELIEESLERKRGLLEMFRKHSKWEERQLCIHFDADYERQIDRNALYHFVNWLCMETAPRATFYSIGVKPGTTQNINTITTGEYPQYWGGTGHYLLKDDIACLPNLNIIPEPTEDNLCEYGNFPEILERINKLDEKWNFRPGMKLTKIVNKICQKYGWDKLEEYNKQFAKFADGVTPLKVTRHTTISINPCDFLMMSNGNSWNSCHWIGYDADYNGCCRSGTISYIRDPHSFIVSVIDKDYDGDFLAEAPKIRRQVFGYNDYQLLQSRLYPVSNDSGSEQQYKELRELVEQIVADSLGEPNRWVKAPSQNVMHGGTCYPDWIHYERNCWTYILRDHEQSYLQPIEMGKWPICIKCGESHEVGNSLTCESCTRHYCASCGCEIFDIGDAIEYDGEYYCTECRRECDRCGDSNWREDMFWITDVEEYYCEYCRDNYTFHCDDCGEDYSTRHTTHYMTGDGRTICEECANNYVRCENCGSYFEQEDTEEIGGEMFCESCAEVIHAELAEREEEEERIA